MWYKSPGLIALNLLLTIHSIYAKPPAQVPKSECRSLMDLIIVLDGSDSISALDYQKQREALTSLVQELGLGPNKAQVGLVVYSSSIAQTVPLTHDEPLLINETSNLIHPRDGTKTSLGISKMRELFQTGGRPGIPWVCIVVTDGLSKNPPATKKEALLAKEMGISMFAVGISRLIEKSELDAIASNPKQVLLLKSFDQLRVSLSSLMKVVCPCPPLPPLSNGAIDLGPRSIGSTRTFTCDPGYQAMGNPTVRCLPDSTWSPLEYACLSCPPPPINFGHGIVATGAQTLQTVREYVCEPGYSSPEPLLSKCIPGDLGPVWTTPKVKCLSCPPPPAPMHGYMEPKLPHATIGTVASFQCLPGFIPTGPISSTCVNDKGIPGWTTPKHSCIACGPPPIIPFGVVDAAGGVLVNDVRIYSCEPGFHATGPIEAICMGEKGATYWKMSPHKCIACDEPPHLPNAVLNLPGDTSVGSIRSFQCLKGFQPTGPIEVTCIAANGMTAWDGPHHTCVACTPPPIIPNAMLDPLGDTLIGSIRQYACMKGYVPTGPIEVGCISGTGGPLWTAPEFQCVTCDLPPPIPNAILDLKGDNFVGHQRYYNCLDGFAPTKPGPIMTECIGEFLNGKGRAFWSPPSHGCTACPPAPIIDLALVLPGNNLIGSVRTYECAKGLFQTGPIIITCMPNGQWSPPDHTCTACGPTPPVPHALALPGTYTLGSVRKYDCAPGFVPNNPPTIECLVDAKWSPVSFACVACGDPYPVTHSVLEPGDNLVGSIRRFTCLPGYLATGPVTTTCAIPPKMTLPDWSTPVHYCKDCGEPVLVQNADVVPGTKTIGAVANYMCHKGFVASAPPMTHCMTNGEWTPVAFKCLVEQTPAPPTKKIIIQQTIKKKCFPFNCKQVPKKPFLPTGWMDKTKAFMNWNSKVLPAIFDNWKFGNGKGKFSKYYMPPKSTMIPPMYGKKMPMFPVGMKTSREQFFPMELGGAMSKPSFDDDWYGKRMFPPFPKYGKRMPPPKPFGKYGKRMIKPFGKSMYGPYGKRMPIPFAGKGVMPPMYRKRMPWPPKKRMLPPHPPKKVSMNFMPPVNPVMLLHPPNIWYNPCLSYVHGDPLMLLEMNPHLQAMGLEHFAYDFFHNHPPPIQCL